MVVRLKTVFSSHFTDFDIPDFKDVMPEAYEMVEKGHVTEQDFRESTFTNAARLHTRNNPDFFKGSVVERPWRKNWACGTRHLLSPFIILPSRR